MCFEINEEVEAPMVETVYKVVDLRGEKAVSRLFYRHWYPGVHKLHKNASVKRRGRFGDCAKEGFYVYLTKAVALRELKRINNFNRIKCVLLKLHVKPEDWIASSLFTKVATYRKVSVPESQPDLEWY